MTTEPVTVTVESGSNLDAGHADLCVMSNDVTVRVDVPTYNGYANFEISAAICDDGEAWLVSMPFLAEEGVKRLPDGHEIANGIMYLGTPDKDDSECPYSVGVTDPPERLACFKTYDDALGFFNSLPPNRVEAGDYYIDGPEV